MRISDWSSDVCSSDLFLARKIAARRAVDETAFDLGRKQPAVLIDRTRGPRNAEHHRKRVGLAVHAGARVDADDHLRPREAVRRQIIDAVRVGGVAFRSDEHTSELQSLMRNSYAVFCLTKKNKKTN